MKKVALVFAGGVGQRMNADIPKQFLQVSGKEIIIRTIELFEKNKNIDEIYVVCIENWIPILRKLIDKHELNKVIKIIKGGINGQDSIYNGLLAIEKNNSNAYVLIHDGVRPLVSQETINSCVKCVEENGSAVTAIPCYETPIISEDGIKIDDFIERKKMYMAQAPQCFSLKKIILAHKKEREKGELAYNNIVDSCSLMNKYGYSCNMVIGNRGNIKVTTIEDLFNLISNYNFNDYKFLMDISESKNSGV